MRLAFVRSPRWRLSQLRPAHPSADRLRGHDCHAGQAAGRPAIRDPRHPPFGGLLRRALRVNQASRPARAPSARASRRSSRPNASPGHWRSPVTPSPRGLGAGEGVKGSCRCTTQVDASLPGRRARRQPGLRSGTGGRDPPVRLPAHGMLPRTALQMVRDELHPRRQRPAQPATFVTTWMEPEAEQLMASAPPST